MFYGDLWLWLEYIRESNQYLVAFFWQVNRKSINLTKKENQMFPVLVSHSALSVFFH